MPTGPTHGPQVSGRGNIISPGLGGVGRPSPSGGTTPTDYQYTGQYSYAGDFGLLFYNARWYDSALGRFAQADTIVPGGTQGLDRYAYVQNSPLVYVDPSGHWPCLYCSIQAMVRVLVRLNEIKNAAAVTDPRSSLPADPSQTTAWLVGELSSNAASEYVQQMSNQNAEAYSLGGSGFAEASETWVSSTRKDAIWDFKYDIGRNREGFFLQGSRNVSLGDEYETHYEALANIHYGYVGTAAGFNSAYLQAGAGLFQRKDLRGPITTYLDEPFDNYWIRFGIFLYEEFGRDGLTNDEFNRALKDFHKKHGDPGKPHKGIDER